MKQQLNNGEQLPYLGYGVYQLKDGPQVIEAIHWALEAGYRLIDTAALYGNEGGVGEAVRSAHVKRSEIFVTSKVWNSDLGYESTLKAFDESMNKLGLDYLDLYLIHWPVKGKYKDSWRALEKLYKEGRVKSIGVSNFLQFHLEDLAESASVVPAVNQMEFHPYLLQNDLLQYCQQKNIAYQAWSPLMQGRIVEVAQLQTLAEKYQKTVAQISLRWCIQKGVSIIPKSAKKHRIQENAQLFDFEISPSDVQLIDALDQGKRFGPDPANFDF